nr:uncharacterized protein LOC105733411 [Aotus nancymaae]
MPGPATVRPAKPCPNKGPVSPCIKWGSRRGGPYALPALTSGILKLRTKEKPSPPQGKDAQWLTFPLCGVWRHRDQGLFPFDTFQFQDVDIFVHCSGYGSNMNRQKYPQPPGSQETKTINYIIVSLATHQTGKHEKSHELFRAEERRTWEVRVGGAHRLGGSMHHRKCGCLASEQWYFCESLLQKGFPEAAMQSPPCASKRSFLEQKMESELREGSRLMEAHEDRRSPPLWPHPLLSDFAALHRRLGICFSTLQQGPAWDTQIAPEWPCANPVLRPQGALHLLRALSPLCYSKDQSSLQRTGAM